MRTRNARNPIARSYKNPPCLVRVPSLTNFHPYPSLPSISLGFLRSPSMAESDPQSNQSGREEMEKLQYLEILHLAAIRMVLFVSNLYLFAKEKSGRLRNGVESVEGAVKTVIGPVYERYHDLPFYLLKIADLKVSESVQLLECHLPEAVKEAYAKAYKAPELARSVAGEVQRVGVVATAAGLVKAASIRAEPAAERLAASAWRSLNRLPVFPQVASAVVPAAAGLSERYNRVVSCAAEKGYAVSAFLPLVPTDRIARVFDS